MTASESGKNITYSRGRDTFDNCPVPCSVESFSEFRDIVFSDRAEKKGKQYITATFSAGPHPKNPDKYPGKKGWRSAQHTQSRRWFAMDVDGCSSPEAFQELKRACSKYSCFGYTTASHTPDSPRARLIFELTRPVDRIEGLELGLGLEHGFDNNPSGHTFKFDKSVYKGEQPIYLALHDAETFSFNGAPIDPDQWPNPEPQSSANGLNGHKTDWLKQLLRGKSVHDSARAISMSMVGDGVKKEIVMTTLHVLLKETAKHRDTKRIARLLDGGELDDLVNGAFQKVAEDRRPSFDEVMEQARGLESFDGDDTELAEAVENMVAEAAFFSQIRKDLVYKKINENTPLTLGALRALEKANREKKEPEPDDGTLARQLRNKIGSENIIEANSYLYLWEGKGVWRPLADREVKQLVLRFITGKIAKVSKSRQDSVTDLFITEAYCPGHQFDVGPPECVNVPNGELVLEGNEWQLHPHKRTHFRTTQIPVEWDPTAQAPRFTQFLQQVFEGDSDADDKAWALLEMMGYTLMAHCHHEKFIILVGTGANGKSVLLYVLEWLCGRDNVAGVQPYEFGNRFQRAHLLGKHANIVSELRQGKLIDDEALKGITSGELTTVERKNKDPFDLRPFATCWFGTNHMPHTRDFSDALFRRALVVPFNRQFKPELGNCDPMLKEKLVEELPGILRMVLNAYKRALAQGFTIPVSSFEAGKAWRLEADQVAQFVEDSCVVAPDGSVQTSELYFQYRYWADSCGIKNKVGIKQFRDRLTLLGFGDKRVAAGKRVTGLELQSKLKSRPVRMQEV